MSLQPRPNCTTQATFPQMLEWLNAVSEGRWTWLRNSACKYVTLKIDTRAGAYGIEDRDGNRITLDELVRQFGEQP
jgi:hypothetical protein